MRGRTSIAPSTHAPQDEEQREHVRARRAMPPRPDDAPHASRRRHARGREVASQARSRTASYGQNRIPTPSAVARARRAHDAERRSWSAACCDHRGRAAGGASSAAWREAAPRRTRLELLVDLRELRVPVLAAHDTVSLVRPYRSIFLYRFDRGMSSARAVSVTFQSNSRSFARRNARSAACLNSSNVLQSSSVPRPPRSATRRPTRRSTSSR